MNYTKYYPGGTGISADDMNKRGNDLSRVVTNAPVYHENADTLELPGSGKIITNFYSTASTIVTAASGTLPDGTAGDILYHGGVFPQNWLTLSPYQFDGGILVRNTLATAPYWKIPTLHGLMYGDAHENFSDIGWAAFGDIPWYSYTTTTSATSGSWDYIHLPPLAQEGWVMTLKDVGGGDLAPEWLQSQTLPVSGVRGDVLYYDSGQWQTLAIGEETQVLTVSSGLPVWDDGAGALDGYQIYLAGSSPAFIANSTVFADASSLSAANLSLEFDVTSTSFNTIDVFNPILTTAVPLYDTGPQTFYRLPIIRDNKRISNGGAYRENVFCSSNVPIAELIRI